MAPGPAPSANDPSADLLRQERGPPLAALFAPRGVAVIGATERAGSVGRAVLTNLIDGRFGGALYPIHPRAKAVLGLPAYPAVGLAPGPVDLAVIATPAAGVPALVEECARKGVRACVIISAGFKESSAEGARLEAAVARTAERARMRLLGPGSLGVMAPFANLNATVARGMARKGNVAFLSQSGALQTAILDWSLQQNVGFSAFVDVGGMAGVGWGDLIDHLGDDPATRSILIHLETVGDARAFLSAAREVALRKPIIVIRGGRTPEGARAALAQTGLPVESDEVLTAAFRRVGVLRVDTIADLFFMADTLAKQPRPRGRRLSILSNAGGPGVLAIDALVSGNGALAGLVELRADTGPEPTAAAVQAALADPRCDGVLSVLAPRDLTESTNIARALGPLARAAPDKPLLAAWMGGESVAEGRRLLAEAGIPVFHYADTAARIFNYMWKSSYNLRGLYETPALTSAPALAQPRAAKIVAGARAAGRTQLEPSEAAAVLEAYGIPLPQGGLAQPGAAQPPAGPGQALLVRSAQDPQFGPVLAFGSSGPLAQAFKDRSLGLPPLNTTLALRLMEQTRVHALLAGQPGVDLAALEGLLVRFSQLVVEQRAIREIDLDPLWIAPGQLVALGARIALHDPQVPDAELPAPVIRPYPVQYVGTAALSTGEQVAIRPIRPEDEPGMVRFHATLSQQSVYRRYSSMLKLDLRTAHDRLSRICFLDYDRELALVAELAPAEAGPAAIVAVGRLARLPGGAEAEFALLVSDALQGRGLGRELLVRLLRVGRDWGLSRVVAEILPENGPMRRLCRSLGFRFLDQTRAVKELGPDPQVTGAKAP